MEAKLKQLPLPGVYLKGDIDLLALLSSLETKFSSGEAGAMACFLGISRVTSRDGRQVSYIEMEAYEENANREIEKICKEVSSKYSLLFTGVWHLLGRFYPGEPVVLVATLGARRASVLSGLDEAVERYKREPALFKKEVYGDGTYRWVEG